MNAWSLVNRCPRWLCGCLVLLFALVVARSWPARASGDEGRLLSDGEMAAIVGDAPLPQWCWNAFKCSDGFVNGTTCVKCDSTTARKVCCQVTVGATLCTSGGPSQCSGNDRYYSASYSTVSCGNCTTTVWTEDMLHICAALGDAVCTKGCSP